MQNNSASGIVSMIDTFQENENYPSVYSKKEEFIAKNPNTWPSNPTKKDIKNILKKIINETIVDELENVIGDITKSNRNLEGRGHVVALALLCAVDAVSLYGYREIKEEICKECGRGDKVSEKYQKFINNFFPEEYKQYSKKLYKQYRCSSVHSWHFFEVQICPENEPLKIGNDNILQFGLLKFFKDFKSSIDKFIEELDKNEELQESALCRYEELMKNYSKK